jgi:hypothetical protein
MVSQMILNASFILFTKPGSSKLTHTEACFYLQVSLDSRPIPDSEIKKVITPTVVPLRSTNGSP